MRLPPRYRRLSQRGRYTHSTWKALDGYGGRERKGFDRAAGDTGLSADATENSFFRWHLGVNANAAFPAPRGFEIQRGIDKSNVVGHALPTVGASSGENPPKICGKDQEGRCGNGPSALIALRKQIEQTNSRRDAKHRYVREEAPAMLKVFADCHDMQFYRATVGGAA